MLSEPLLVVARVAREFEKLGIRYVVADRSPAQSTGFRGQRRMSTS
jgi:hypothetical protein